MSFTESHLWAFEAEEAVVLSVQKMRQHVYPPTQRGFAMVTVSTVFVVTGSRTLWSALSQIFHEYGEMCAALNAQVKCVYKGFSPLII